MQNHLPAEKFEKLKEYAEKLSCYYFSPVFLIGSCLERDNYNDVDVFVVLKDEYFNIRYGENDIRLKLAKDTEKRWRDGCRFTGLVLDLKIIPRSAFLRVYPNNKKQRLDTTKF